MIDRRSARRRLPDCPAPYLAAEAILNLDGHPAGCPSPGRANRLLPRWRACLRAMVKVTATLGWLWPPGYGRGDGVGVGGCRSRWQTTACTRTRSRSQATTRRMIPSSS
jgi:hypothetical protein